MNLICYLNMFSIVHGNEGQAFTINQNTGSVYVSPFHQTTMFSDEYSLNISVSDGIYTSFTSLTVTVRAANRWVVSHLSVDNVHYDRQYSL